MEFGKKITLLLIISTFFTTLNAQVAGVLDPTFNTSDDGTRYSLLGSSCYAMAIQSDDKILVGGYFTDVNGTNINRLARLNADGSLDQSFDIGTGPTGPVFAIAIQPDGKILAGGNFSMFDGSSHPDIIRLNADGSVDNTFSSGTGTSSPVEAIAIQPDGKILIGGGFTSYNGSTAIGVARLNADGSLDNTFNTGSGPDEKVESISIQSNGKIIVGGDFQNFDNQTRTRLARLNADGSLDLNYNVTIAGSFTDVDHTLIQPDGSLLIGGSFSTVEGSVRKDIARVDASGNLDATFNPVVDNEVSRMALQSDGKIVIAGSFQTVNGNSSIRVARLNADGSSDLSFNTAVGPDNILYTVALQSNNKVLIGGTFEFVGTVDRNHLARLNTDGSNDVTFAASTGANGTVYTTAVQPDGKIIVGGYFTSMNGVSRNRIARLNADGSLDTSFDPGTGFDGNVWSVQLQPDGKIIVGGFFTTFDGTTQNRICRLNANGSLDNTFNVAGAGTDAVVVTTYLQSDGKILIGGFFTSVNGETHNRIARLNIDGTIDATFDAGTGAGDNVWTIQVQDDNKIVVGGFFTSFDGQTRNRICRLNADGSLDNTFDAGVGPDANVFKTVIQDDGKIIIGGFFENLNGQSQNRVARLNSDGTQDMSFNVGVGASSTVRALHLQDDGKVLVGGFFNTFNGAAHGGIIRLNSDGSTDNTFMSGSGTDGIVYEINQQDDGKFLVGGEFGEYDGTPKNRIIRLQQDMSTAVETQFESMVAVYPNPANGDLIQFNQHISGVVYNAAGQAITTVTKSKLLDIQNLEAGLYFIQTDKGLKGKFIVE